MSKIFYNSQLQPIQLANKLGTGGEGSVYEIFGQSDFVAKIYHELPEPEKAEKLIALSRLGNERLLKLAAWPVDVLRVEADGQLAGFVMKKIGQASEVHTLHSPKSRLQKFPEASWAFLIYVAANIARAVATMHEHDFIVGDLNPKNILVTHQATVALLDCDSFQVTADGKTFRCEGGFPEYLPPELQGKSLRDVERIQSHDCFGLAVVIFQLLFMGRHPFSGRFLGTGELTLEDAIRKARFAFGADAAARRMQQPPGTLPLEAIPVSLIALFRRAFLSADRPQPSEWIEPLETLVKSLKACELHTGHFYFNELLECPWCEIEMRARIRLFNFSLNGHNGRSHFQLDQVWQKIEELHSMPNQIANANSVLALADMKNRLALPAITKPSEEVATYARGRNIKLLQAAVFTAIAAFAIGYFADWSVAVVLAFLAGGAAKRIAGAEFKSKGPQVTNFGQQTLPPANNPLAEKVRTALIVAEQKAQQIEAQLQKVPSDAHWQAKLAELKNRREVHERLPKIREFKLKQLERVEGDRQLTQFLDQFQINQAQVKDIDGLTVAALRARGIETAADLTPEALKQVPDLTQPQAQQLLFWRASAKREFKFDWARDVQAQQRLTVEREMDNLRMQVEHDLSTGAVYLQRLHHEATSQRQQIAKDLPEAYRLQAQSEKDWEVAQKANPMWPLMLVLVVFFLYGSFVSLYREIPGMFGPINTRHEYPPSSISSSEAPPPTAEELSSDQTEARAFFEKGEKLMRQRSWSAAAKQFRRAAKLNPQYQAAYTQLGHALYRQRRYDESIDNLLKAKGMGEEFEPNFHLGLAYRAKGQWKLAANSFQRANDLNDIDLYNNKADPNRADAYYYWGEAMMKTGQIKDIVNNLESSADTGSITALERLQLATFYLVIGKGNQAKQQYSILKNEDEELAVQLQRLMKQHLDRQGRG